LLATGLTQLSPAAITPRSLLDLQCRYALAWQHEFTRRLQVAALYAHVAMRPLLAHAAGALVSRWPSLLTEAARLAGKDRVQRIGPSSTGARNEYT
jgi:hypothetical protein